MIIRPFKEMPSDEIIDKAVEHRRALNDAIAFGAYEFNKTIVLTDKRGFIQETVTFGPKRETIGFRVFVEGQADPS